MSVTTIPYRVFDRPPVGAWYSDAVIYRLSVSAFCDGDHDGIGDFAGLALQLAYLRTLGVTCLQLSPLPRTAAGEFARFLPAARHHQIRVLFEMDMAGRDRPVPRARDEARFWLAAGADGVVLPSFPGASPSSAESQSRGARSHAEFFALNGVPVPYVREGHLRELGTFRAQAVPAIVEALGRENAIPVLGLMVRLALRIASRSMAVWSSDDGRSVDDFERSAPERRRLVALAGPDPRCADLLRKLVFSLPGPAILVSGDEIGMGDKPDSDDGHCRIAWPSRGSRPMPVEDDPPCAASVLRQVRSLADLRRRSPALRCGLASPVGLGAGPGLAFVREFARDVVLVVANFSAEPLQVACDATAYKGRQAIEMLRQRPFPPVVDDQYGVLLPPYGCYWLHLVTS